MMFKGYVYFTASLVMLIFSEAWLVNSYVKDVSFPWDSLSAFLFAVGAIYVSLEQFKMERRIRRETEKDIELFKELMVLMPPEKTISFFRKADFNERVLRSELDGLRQFRAYWGSVDKEFFDNRIETDKKKIYSAIDTFMEKYSTYTVPLGNGDFASVFPDSMHNFIHQEARINSLKEQAQELNSLADSFANQYEIFVRNGKRKFII